MPDIFKYSSYRSFIKDYYEAKKAEYPRFSYQAFSQKIGLRAKTYLIHVINGKRPLSTNSLFGFTKAMGLNSKETAYFEALVNFNNAKSPRDREIYYERLELQAGRTPAKHIDSEKYEYFSTWYHPVVRELVVAKEFQGSYDSLAKRVKPRLTAKQVKNSVKLLENLNLVKKQADGSYRLQDAQITTGVDNEIINIAITKHQKEMMKLAEDALERYDVTERHITSVTAGISKNCYENLVTEISQLKKKFITIINQDKEPQNMVYQFNFQAFPLSEEPKSR